MSKMANMPVEGKGVSPAAIATLMIARGYAKHLREPEHRARTSIVLEVATNEGGRYYVRPCGEIRIGETLDVSTPVLGDERRRMLGEVT